MNAGRDGLYEIGTIFRKDEICSALNLSTADQGGQVWSSIANLIDAVAVLQPYKSSLLTGPKYQLFEQILKGLLRVETWTAGMGGSAVQKGDQMWSLQNSSGGEKGFMAHPQSLKDVQGLLDATKFNRSLKWFAVIPEIGKEFIVYLGCVYLSKMVFERENPAAIREECELIT